ncbi:MAG: helix-turn-helix domain-containing protein [Lachnospiraceae bacterium]|mgnify:CR=1 FL=1|nr:helix-turn-helix domain-containing protein [Lachnospiraceae bacterium]
MEGKHEHFGLAIKNARIDCGLTQETLAEMAGISCRYLIANFSAKFSNFHHPKTTPRKRKKRWQPVGFPAFCFIL